MKRTIAIFVILALADMRQLSEEVLDTIFPKKSLSSVWDGITNKSF